MEPTSDSPQPTLPCLTYVADLVALLRGAGVARFVVPGLLALELTPSPASPLPVGADLEATHQDRPLSPEEQAVARKVAAARGRARTWEDPALWGEYGGHRPSFGTVEG